MVNFELDPDYVYTIKARGQWFYNHKEPGCTHAVGPEGCKGNNGDGNYPSNLQQGGLIFRVVGENKWRHYQSERTIGPGVAGILEFRINDPDYACGDNSDKLSVNIRGTLR